MNINYVISFAFIIVTMYITYLATLNMSILTKLITPVIVLSFDILFLYLLSLGLGTNFKQQKIYIANPTSSSS